MDNKKFSRRKFLKTAGAAVLGTAVAMVPDKSFSDFKKATKARYAMVIDLRKCTGCHACSVACKSEFAMPLGVWKSWVEQNEEGKYPKTRRKMLPRLCNHCDDPPCVPVCPVGATYIEDNGTVVVDAKKCIGCKSCIMACPYKSRFLNPETHTADKCDFCLHRVAGGVVPACVNTCPARTRVFGDLNDKGSEVSKFLKKNRTRIFTLKPELKTGPQVFYIKKEG